MITNIALTGCVAIYVAGLIGCICLAAVGRVDKDRYPLFVVTVPIWPVIVVGSLYWEAWKEIRK